MWYERKIMWSFSKWRSWHPSSCGLEDLLITINFAFPSNFMRVLSVIWNSMAAYRSLFCQQCLFFLLVWPENLHFSEQMVSVRDISCSNWWNEWFQASASHPAVYPSPRPSPLMVYSKTTINEMTLDIDTVSIMYIICTWCIEKIKHLYCILIITKQC